MCVGLAASALLWCVAHEVLRHLHGATTAAVAVFGVALGGRSRAVRCFVILMGVVL